MSLVQLPAQEPLQRRTRLVNYTASLRIAEFSGTLQSSRLVAVEQVTFAVVCSYIRRRIVKLGTLLDRDN